MDQGEANLSLGYLSDLNSGGIRGRYTAHIVWAQVLLKWVEYGGMHSQISSVTDQYSFQEAVINARVGCTHAKPLTFNTVITCQILPIQFPKT